MRIRNIVIALVALSAPVRAQNFNAFASQDGCKSVIADRERSTCEDLQRTKNDTCNRMLDCDLDKQQRQIDKYNDAKKQLDSGSIADADKDRLKQTIRELKDDLDARKDAARKGIEPADKCVRARTDVQEFFERVAIPLTERLRDAALKERQGLLDQLAAAQEKVRNAKDKRDKSPGDSSASSDYDAAVSALRDVEKKLETFNSTYGPDIPYNAEQLIRRYKDGKASHQKPIDEAKNRYENCKKLDNLSY
jgi:hypothetical protein